jgi:phage/plasmid-associated DNA primase
MEYISFSFDKIITYTKNNTEKKKYIGLPTDWSKLTKSSINPLHSGRGILTGKINNITIIDFDNEDSFNTFWSNNKHLNMYDYKMVKTRRGYHIYFEYNKDCITGTDCFNDYIDIDIRNDGGFITAPPTHYTCLDGSIFSYEDLGGNILPMPNELLCKLKTKPKQEIKKNDEIKNGIINELCDIINIKYIDCYSDWLRIVFSLASINNYELAKSVSMKSIKYEDESFDRVYSSNKGLCTIGTIYYYAKLSNPTEYLKIIIKFNEKNIDNVIKSPTQENMARCFVELFGDDFIYTNDKIYYFNGIVWEESKLALRRKFTNDFTNLFLDKQIFYMNKMKLYDADGDEYKNYKLKCDAIYKIIVSLQSNKNIKDVCNDAIKPYIENKNIEFEINPYIFCFENKIFDLQKCDFVLPYKYDYMTLTTGYNYTSPTSEQINKMNNVISDIFPIESERALYLIILSTGLFGKTLEYFTLANGTGRNGKGLLNELAIKTFGNYAYTCSNVVLMNDLKDGTNQSIANMNHKRFIIYREPKESINSKLNSSVIKELTGGSEINARGIYSSNTKTNLKGTHIEECNAKPKIDGEVNDALLKRIIDIPFRTSFTANNKDEIDRENNILMPDSSFKELSFQNDYKIALFHILIPYWKMYNEHKQNINDFIPESIKNIGIKYLQDGDDIFSWFQENYILTDNAHDIVQLKDIYDLFKDSEYYMNLSKSAKRELNKMKFCEKLSKNIFLKKYHKEYVFLKNDGNNTQIRNVIINYKLNQ